jgi:uncharacterized protein (DUF1778 family)
VIARTEEAKDDRLQVRLDSEAKRVLRWAASYKRKTASQFVLATALEETEKVIRENEAVTLSAADWKVFYDARANPPAPNAALRKAFAKYKKRPDGLGGSAMANRALDGKRHDRSTFSCSAPDLDRYIRDHASQDVKRNVARVFVTVAPEDPTARGYYSLSAASFRREPLPAKQAKRLPRIQCRPPCSGASRWDAGMKGKGLGAFLLFDALNRVLLATQTLAVHALVVDAKDEAAAGFYRKYGFVAFPSEGQRLFLPMATVRRLVER